MPDPHHAPTGLTFTIERPDSEAARNLISELDADLLERYPKQFIHGLHPEDIDDPGLVFVVARDGVMPVGCGALRRIDSQTAEVKRMFVVPGLRGRGFARQILGFLEGTARKAGYATLRLETGARQHEAVGLYRSVGYSEIACYGEYVGNPFSVCFEKGLD